MADKKNNTKQKKDEKKEEKSSGKSKRESGMHSAAKGASTSATAKGSNEKGKGKSVRDSVQRTLDDVFMESLQSVLAGERAIAQALPDLIESIDSRALREAVERHASITEMQIERLERILEELQIPPQPAAACPAMDALVAETNVMAATSIGAVRDAALLGALQAVELYEIARYGTLHAWAEVLGERECARLLLDTLDEEREADDILSRIAESRVNPAATTQACRTASPTALTARQ